jgi:hypothetical protein
MQGLSTIAQPLLAAGEPAGGTPVAELIPATAVAAVLSAGVVALAAAHRSGRIAGLGRLAASAGRLTGLPGWASLPLLVHGAALILAAFGFYWDVAIHIDDGRDAGAFANGSHFLILAGLGGIALAGFLAVVLGTGDERPTSLRLARGWHAPLGGVVILVCGSLALSGFPLDDLWHRLFGQDVTLWGPTHVLMVGGASLSTLGGWILLVEGRRAADATGARPRLERAHHARELTTAAGFLAALSTLQLEFGYGVPQFQLLYHPLMIVFAAGLALVAVRFRLGRGAALIAAVAYAVPMGLMVAVIGPGLGHTTLHFPLYIAEALVVELVALKVSSDRPVALGAWSGLAIGTAGLAAEWGWSHLWMPIPWPASLLPEAAVLGLLAALAGGVLGGFLGRSLAGSEASRERVPRWLAPAAGVAAIACLLYPLPITKGEPVTVALQLDESSPGPQREVVPTVRVEPRDAADGAGWFNVLAWQGGGSRLEPLEEVRPGTYRTRGPIPVHGEWKALVRLQDGSRILAAPIYLPRDDAIPAGEVPAPPLVERQLVLDREIVRREATGGPLWLEIPAYGLLIGVAASWLASIVWAVRRLAGRGPGRTARRRPPRLGAGLRRPRTAEGA